MQQNCESPGAVLLPMFKFSEKNFTQVTTTLQSLDKFTNICAPWQHKIFSSERLLVGDLDSECQYNEECKPKATEMMDCIVIDDDTWIEDPLTTDYDNRKRIDLHLADTMGEPLIAQTLSTTTSHKDHLVTNIKEEEESTDSCLLMAAECRLKEHWLNANPNSSSPADLNILTSLSPEQVGKLLVLLDLPTFPELAWAQVCQDVLSMTPALSQSILIMFFFHAVVPRFLELNQTASRIFSTSFISMAEKFPRQLVDSICSSLKGRELTSAQADILQRLPKDRIAGDGHGYLLKQLVSCGALFTEHMACLLQSLLRQQGEPGPAMLTSTIKCLLDAAHSMADSTHYGKLLLQVIRHWGQQLSPGQISSLQFCLDAHKTFMKKSATAALRQLQQ